MTSTVITKSINDADINGRSGEFEQAHLQMSPSVHLFSLSLLGEESLPNWGKPTICVYIVFHNWCRGCHPKGLPHSKKSKDFT